MNENETNEILKLEIENESNESNGLLKLEIENETKIEFNSTSKKHFCYILFDKFGYTYNGYTNNKKRRIRQHNQEIKGGAKYTTKKQSFTKDKYHWKYILSISSDDQRFDYRKALSMEWFIKNPTSKRTRCKRTPINRIDSLTHVFKNKKFEDIHFDLYMHQECFFEPIRKSLEETNNVTLHEDVI
jgi:predicted GIY-YIG superfamily endonuclease